MRLRVAGYTFLISLVISGLFYVLFDQYITSVGQETIKAWLKSEENSIAEGNLLASVTKTQKVLLSSDFLKGLVVYDFSGAEARVLLEFGERPIFARPETSFQINSTGFLKKQILVVAPSRQDILIGFSIFSDRLVNIYWVTNLFFVVLLMGFTTIVVLIKRQEELKVALYAKRAAQASHDLAQPLMALNSILGLVQEKSEAVKTLGSVIERINLIADDLILNKRKNVLGAAAISPKSLKESIQSLIKEKRVRVGTTVEILTEIENTDFAGLEEHSSEILRFLSNLVDNSIEALPVSGGRIVVSLNQWTSAFGFCVTDTGAGIPKDILPKLGQPHFTYRKSNGTGLGLSGAKTFVESLGGVLKIESTVNVGTSVKITIPKKETSIPKLFLTTDSRLLVIDDDEICLETWKIFFESIGAENSINYFSSPRAASDFILNASPRSDIFLFSDFNLSSELDGLDFIKNHGLSGQSALVTGQAFDGEVLTRAAALNIPVYQKSDLGKIPLQFI